LGDRKQNKQVFKDDEGLLLKHFLSLKEIRKMGQEMDFGNSCLKKKIGLVKCGNNLEVISTTWNSRLCFKITINNKTCMHPDESLTA
jgi:hypothetical protein